MDNTFWAIVGHVANVTGSFHAKHRFLIVRRYDKTPLLKVISV